MDWREEHKTQLDGDAWLVVYDPLTVNRQQIKAYMTMCMKQ